MTHDDDTTTGHYAIPRQVIPPAGKPCYLQMVKGPGAPISFPLTEVVTVIGRSANADLSFTDESLSRLHAQLVRVGEEHQVEDLESRNGVFLNGVRIHSAVLRTGDSLQLGELVFVYAEGIHV